MSARQTPLRWRKSRFSQNGDCVEWASDKEYVYVRHSSHPSGTVLRFTHAEWQAFVAGAKSGEADLNAEDTSR